MAEKDNEYPPSFDTKAIISRLTNDHIERLVVMAEGGNRYVLGDLTHEELITRLTDAQIERLVEIAEWEYQRKRLTDAQRARADV